MNQEQLRSLAYNCGAKPHTKGVMRAVTGVTMTYEQLTKFAAALDTTWKEAVINELVVAHIYQAKHDTDPRQAIQDAISWNTSVALDPLVSSDAQKLIKQGAAVEREACAKLAREIGNATEPDDWALDKCEEIETAIRARALK